MSRRHATPVINGKTSIRIAKPDTPRAYQPNLLFVICEITDGRFRRKHQLAEHRSLSG